MSKQTYAHRFRGYFDWHLPGSYRDKTHTHLVMCSYRRTAAATHFPCGKHPSSSSGHTGHTHEILDQLRVGHERLRVGVDGVSAVLDLPQGFKVAQQHITEPLSVHTWDLPLLCLFIFKPNRSERDEARQNPDFCKSWDGSAAKMEGSRGNKIVRSCSKMLSMC